MILIHNSDIYFCCLKNSLNSITDIEYVVESLAAKYNKVKKGLGDVMGGKVLNYEAKDILNRGRAEGRMEGRREGEEYTKIQIATKLLNMGNDIKSVAELAELPQETVEKLAQSISKEEK